MAFGDSRDDEGSARRLARFCDRLKAAGDQVFKDYNPATPLQRADAFRFLTQNLGQAFDLALETKDTQFPVIHAFCAPDRKLGGDNADFIYLQAWIDGESVYKISGNEGHGALPELHRAGPAAGDAASATDRRSLHEPFGDMPEANLFGQRAEDRTGTAASSSTSVASSAGRTGCRRRRARASCSSGRASTAGTRSRPSSASSGSTWTSRARCRRPTR